MLNLATRGNQTFDIFDFEIKKKEVTYTYQTVERLKELYPGSEICFVLGADSVLEIKTWMKWRELLSELWILVGQRPGFSLEHLEETVRNRAVILNNPIVDISASEIRKRIREGKTVKYMLPEPVERYIAGHNLYRG